MVENLSKILTDHAEWLDDTCDGKRADLCGLDLREVNFGGADLSNVDFCGVDLSNTNLSGYDISGADMRFANLRGAILCETNLLLADLRFTDLREANLCGADMRFANLGWANINGANLCGANLSGVRLRNTKLNDIKADVKFIQFENIGKLESIITYCFEMDTIWHDCFIGSLDKFEKEVEEIHKDNPPYLKKYRDTIERIRKAKEVV